MHVFLSYYIIWDKEFKNGASKNCGRQPLKHLKGYGLLIKQTITSNFLMAVFHNFTWSIIEYFVPFFSAIPKDNAQIWFEIATKLIVLVAFDGIVVCTIVIYSGWFWARSLVILWFFCRGSSLFRS